MPRLSGRTVVVTRPRERAAELVDALRREGAEVLEFPTIEVCAPEDLEPLDQAARTLCRGGFDWVVLTSARGVEALRDALLRVRDTGTDRVGSLPSSVRVACVGPSTARAAGAAGWEVAVVPGTTSGEALGRELVRIGIAGQRVLFPRAKDAREALVAILQAAGGRVEDVVAYRKVVPERTLPDLGGRIERGEVDVLTFTSPSTVRNFEELLGPAAFSPPIVAIGPTTAAAIEDRTGRRAVVAASASVAGLVDAVIVAVQQRN